MPAPASGTAHTDATPLAFSRARRRLREEDIARGLLDAIADRSEETAAHVDRMSAQAGIVAERLGLDPERCDLIRRASRLHDVGKIALPGDVLRKPGRLTPFERRAMERHPELGHAILSDFDGPMFRLAAVIALTHHECFDGSGYPAGLAGRAIPLEGRIAAVADVFDALTSDRVYRSAMPLEQATDLMWRGSGTQFDPDVLEAFMDHAPLELAA